MIWSAYSLIVLAALAFLMLAAYRGYSVILFAPVATLVLLLIVIVSAVPAVVSGHSPIRLDIAARLAAPDSLHLLGTDAFGRDMLARIAHGGRYTLAVGLGVVALAFVVGAPLGIVSGYIGGWLDTVIMRTCTPRWAAAIKAAITRWPVSSGAKI